MLMCMLMVTQIYAQQPERAPLPQYRPTFTAKHFVMNPKNTGFILVDDTTGEILDALNVEDVFIPASVGKVLTAQYALKSLGTSYTFETRLLKNGVVEDGILKGDLILQGGGDPELNTSHLVELVEALKAAGIRQVTGEFFYDSTALPSFERLEKGQPLTAAYNPSVSGLNLNFNRLNFSWAQKGHAQYEISVTSAADQHIYTTDYASIGYANGVDVRHSVGDYSESWVFSPRILNKAGKRRLPVRNSALYTANVMYWISRDKGVLLPKPRVGQAPVFFDVIATHTSRPVDQIIRGMLQYSTNLTAEALGISASIVRGKRVRNLAESGRAMVATLLPNASTNDIMLMNHSGLSSSSRMTPKATLAALRALDISDFLTPFRVQRLPKGVSIQAKTGTIYYARGLAGYIVLPDKRRLAFVIFTTDYDKRQAYEANFDASAIISAGAQERTWLNRARTLEARILRYWAQHFAGR